MQAASAALDAVTKLTKLKVATSHQADKIIMGQKFTKLSGSAPASTADGVDTSAHDKALKAATVGLRVSCWLASCPICEIIYIYIG